MMRELLHPDDSLERQRDKLLRISAALMQRVEQTPSNASAAFSQFERAALLEAEVRQRTNDLEKTLDLLNQSNAQLAEANQETETARSYLNEAIESVNEGFALFDNNDCLVLHNSRFCRDLLDLVPKLENGMSFKNYVKKVSQSIYLDLPPDMSPDMWVKNRLRRHKDEAVVFNVALTRDRWLQVSEYRTTLGGTVILQMDVTNIMRAERAQREELVDNQSRMLRATLDHLAQGVCIFDKDARLVGWNRKLEELIDLPLPGASLGMTFDNILNLLRGKMSFGMGFGRKWLVDWSNKESGRAPISFEVTRGDTQTFDLFAQEMPDQGFVISFTDVTQERRSAKALREMNRTLEHRVNERTEELGLALKEAKRANESKNRFVAAASHDLLQPLSAAKLFLASLQDRDLEAEAQDITLKAASALSSVEGIIEALLDISKLDAGRAVFDIKPCGLDTMLQSLATEMAPLAETKGLTLDTVSSTATVVSDQVFLRRILQNLISNAIRYTQEGRVLVGVRNAGDQVRVEVHDTGPGIAKEDQARIFQEFAQLAPSRSGSNGLGLGLAIVDRACQSLNHGLDLRSTPGQGSCFSVTLDRDTRKADADEAHGTDLPGANAIRGKMTLLVENDLGLARAITLKIEGWDGHVIHCETGEEAMALLDEIELAPDAMLLDYQLGAGMDGVALCRALWQRYGPVSTAIISASRDASLKRACDEIGIPLLRKPLDTVKLRMFLDSAAT